MTIENTYILSEGENIIFEDLEVRLIGIKREKIDADPVDETIPEGEGIFITFELLLNGKKKTISFSQLSKPYESIIEQTWKDYKIRINKVKEYSVKIKTYYEI